MMINFKLKTKCQIKYTKDFKKNYKKIIKQGKDINKLVNKEELEPKYKDHSLYNDKRFLNCRDCHIENNRVLIYKYLDNEIILLLVNTETHFEVLDK